MEERFWEFLLMETAATLRYVAPAAPEATEHFIVKVNRKGNSSYSYAVFTGSVILKLKYLVKIKKHIITGEEGREQHNKSPFYTLLNMKEDKIPSFFRCF